MRGNLDMVIKEIFPNPTVKHVIFQIRFPNLFFIESKMGDFQLRIMKEFPKSFMSFRRQLMIVDVGPKQRLEDIPIPSDEEYGKKLWQFESEKNYRLGVLSDSLDITSEYHKTYNLGDSNKFRDIIKFAVDNFLQVVSIPIITRIGLRYIDECPLPKKDNETFKSYYNSVFAVDRFNIADADEMFFRATVRRGDYYLTYMESLQKSKDEYKLVLDFDGFAKDVPSEKYLEVTDKLHETISEEYERTIKDPVYEYMRRKVVETAKQ